MPVGNVTILDNGTATFVGILLLTSSTVATVYAINASVTYARQETITSSIPMTWTTGDAIYASGSYETT